MRKTMKKIVSVLVSCLMVMMLFANAFAADDFKITITAPDDDKATHTYAAYQIFTGGLYEDPATGEKSLIDLAFGEGVDAGALKEALVLDASATAQDCADELLKITPEEAADILGDCIIEGTETASVVMDAATEESAELSVPGPGYYCIIDDLTEEATKGAASRVMLKVVGDTDLDFDSKEVLPTIDKVIDDGADGVKANSASIGDLIPFKITSAVPDMRGYDKYQFVVRDTLCKGLTYDAATADLKITVGSKTLTSGTDYQATTAPDGDETLLKIVFKDFIQYLNNAGADIVITYNATLNENCDRTSTGNDNKVDLLYSNDPNYDYLPSSGDEPGPGEPTGVTPESKTVTYTTDIKLLKVDEEGAPLAGAEFEISCDKGMNRTLVTYGQFVEDPSGSYYKLTDGSYTETEPTATTASKYDDTDTTYRYEAVEEEQTAANTKTVTAFVNEDGYLIIEGLCDGTYTITETKAPAGYNGLAAPIEFTIKSNPTVTAPGWAVDGDSENTAEASYNAADNAFELSVENTTGINLPETGGIGTIVFYVAGGLLLLGGTIVLLKKKEQQD